MTSRAGLTRRAALGTAAWALGSGGRAAAATQLPPALEPLPTREIAPGVFVFQAPYALAAPTNDGAIANMGFVVGGDAVAVIDTGNSLRAGLQLRAAVRTRSDRPIRWVVNTHMHPDHTLGNAAFVEAGVEFVGHHKLPRALSARAGAYLDSGHRQIGEEGFAGTRIVLPTRLVETTTELDLGGRSLELQAHPTAHTDNDLTILDRQTLSWFLGDLLFAGHVPTLDGSLLGWLAVMERARSRTVARVVPGHGPGAMAWPEALAMQQRYQERLLADVRALIKQGQGIGEASRQAGLSERERWALFDEFNPRNALTAFHELEWE